MESTASNDTAGGFVDENKVKQGFYTVVFVLGTVGNVLVLIVVAGRRERRTVNDIFIVNLAISDLTYLFLCLPTNLYLTLGSVPPGFYCWFVWPMMTVTICVSIFTLTSMAIHRCRVILNPFRADIKHRSVLIWIVVIWVLGILIVVPMILATRIRTVKPYGCEEAWPSIRYRKAYTACLFVAQYALPLTIIAVEYVRIGIDLFRPKGTRARGDSKRVRANQDLARRKENLQVIKTLATIVILFALTMLPAQLSWMLIDFGGAREIKVGQAFLAICEWLLYTHACLNPIVYGSLTKHYRKGYIRYLTMIFCCRWRLLYRSMSSRSSSPTDDAQSEYTKVRCANSKTKRENYINKQNGNVTTVTDLDQSSEPSGHNQTDRLITDHVVDKNENKVAIEEREENDGDLIVTEKESTI